MKPMLILTLALLLTVAAGAVDRGTVGAAEISGDELDQKVAAAFKARCSVCHDDRPSAGASDVDYLLDFTRLSDPDNGYFDSDQPKASYLREMIEGDKPKMPQPKWKEIEWNGALTEAEKADVLKWIDRGGPSDTYRKQVAAAVKREQRTLIPERAIVERIAADLGQLRDLHLKNARYLTLTNLHNLESVSGDELELYRQAVVKLLNSLSRSSDVLGTDLSQAVKKVVAVDAERTIFRFDLRDIGWTAHDWDRIVRHYPYGLLHRDGVGRSVYSLTSSSFPYLRGDWFVFATSQPPLYHDLVGIPQQLDDLERRLGVTRLQKIRNREVHRAGFGISKVSVNNRLLERIGFPGGYYHISYDFGANDGAGNFFENPLGPVGAFQTEAAFRHDGGEIIYRLPNGFQAYVLVKSNGERLSIAPSAIVHDDSMPGGAIINGVSCLSCHYDGMKPENRAQAASLDKVRGDALKNFRRFNAAERELIDALYPEPATFGRLLEQDRASFRKALSDAGLTATGPNEPVRALFDRFARNLDLPMAAAGFGLSVQEFSKLLGRESETRQLQSRLERSGMQRQLYVVEFRRIADLTGLGEPLKFEPLGLPYFGVDPEQEAAGGGQRVEGPKHHVEAPKVDLLDADNHASTLQVTVSSGDDRHNFREGEVIPCVLKASADCFITVLGIDLNEDVQVLVPNKWHPELKLKAGRSLRIPTPEMGFQFFAEPPHGTTQIRVIATRRPLQIEGLDAASLARSDSGIVSLGNAKSIRGKKGIGVRANPNATTTRPQPPADVDLTRQFAPNDWATARWTFTTHPTR